MKIKKGDLVEVVSGKDRGVRGKVIVAYPERQLVLVEGVNRVTKHTKIGQTQPGAKTGGIIIAEAPVHVSNVMIVTEVDGAKVRSRIGYRTDENGEKVRVAKRSGKDI